MMDYAGQKTLTQCQLSRMHHWLENNSSVVKSGLPNYSILGQISWSGGGATLYPSNNVPDPIIEVNISAPGASYFTWTKTGGNGYWWASGSGQLAHIEISPPNYMTYKVTYEANCNDIEEFFDFYYTGKLYRVYPNPISTQLIIELDQDLYNSMRAKNKQVSNQNWHKITIYDQSKKIIHNKEFNSGFTTYSLDVSGFKPGFYYILIQNPFIEKNFKILKN